MNNVVAVVAFDKNTKQSKAITSCGRNDAQAYAKYYRRIGYNARVMEYDEVDKLIRKESDEMKKYLFE